MGHPALVALLALQAVQHQHHHLSCTPQANLAPYLACRVAWEGGVDGSTLCAQLDSWQAGGGLACTTGAHLLLWRQWQRWLCSLS